jgi:dephospho-CoA kinase
VKVLGVTGNIGSGKSTVCRTLADMCCPVIDADVEAHLSYRRGTIAQHQIVAAFGERVLDPAGRIDRTVLGGIVFSDPESRVLLNSIVHPATRRRVESHLARLSSEGHAWAVLEATLVFEAGWLDLIDRLWVVAAPVDAVVSRLNRDRGQNEQQVRFRIAAQTPAVQMMERADDIIYNDGDLEALRSRVLSLWSELNASTPC